MKSVWITGACLLLGGSGLALLRVLDRSSNGSENRDVTSATRRPHQAGRAKGGQRFQPVLAPPATDTQAYDRQTGVGAQRRRLQATTDLPPQSLLDGGTARERAPLPEKGPASQMADNRLPNGFPSRRTTESVATPSSRGSLEIATERPRLLGAEVSLNNNLDASTLARVEDRGLLLHVPLSPTDLTVAATIPAVLGETGADSGLSEADLAGVAKLADEFIAKVSSISEAPQDPARQRLWAEAQAESDAQMRARYGGHAWLRHHQEAYRQALTSPLTP